MQPQWLSTKSCVPPPPPRSEAHPLRSARREEHERRRTQSRLGFRAGGIKRTRRDTSNIGGKKREKAPKCEKVTKAETQRLIGSSSLPVRHTCTRPSALNLKPLAASLISCTVLLELFSNTLCTRPPLLLNSATFQDLPTKVHFHWLILRHIHFPAWFYLDVLFRYPLGLKRGQCGLTLTPSFDLSIVLTQDLWLPRVEISGPISLKCSSRVVSLCPVPVQPVFVPCHANSSSSARTSNGFCWDIWIKSVKHWDLCVSEEFLQNWNTSRTLAKAH